jgi:hypothetical protein
LIGTLERYASPCQEAVPRVSTSTQFAGWNAGPFAWHVAPLREALKQDTLAIPPRRPLPWQGAHALPSGRAYAGWVETKPAGWLPVASTRLPVEVAVEHPKRATPARRSRDRVRKPQLLSGKVIRLLLDRQAFSGYGFSYLWHARHLASFLFPWQRKQEPGSILPSSRCCTM